MKKILFIALIAFGMNVNAQISLEHTYDSASTLSTLHDQLMIVKFEVSGEKYIRINREGKTIDIYDMNHSLQKTISYASFPQTTNNVPDILYFSENLFNSDPKIEFMYVYTQGTSVSIYHTRIYNEDGLIIFQVDSMGPMITLNFLQQQYPIYNTSVGTKMILSNQFTKQAKVYSLPGTLSDDIQKANTNLVAQSNISNPYPNPAVNTTQIDYELPKDIKQGEIVFYTLQGMEVKRFKVDNAFNSLLISTSDLAAGIYCYQLQTSGQNSAGKKMVVIK